MNIKANGCWYRYSNTLLVSLNNRISIREVTTSIGALPTSQTRPISTNSCSSIMRLELRKPPYTLEERRQSGDSVEDDGVKAVIGKCCCDSFPVFVQYPDSINRHRMIWILNGKVPMDNDHRDWIDYIYFCIVTYESCSGHRWGNGCTPQDGDLFISCTLYLAGEKLL